MSSMDCGQRSLPRVTFTHNLVVRMMAIDGTWRRQCRMLDASQTDARLLVEGSIEGLQLSEFFLVLSPIGRAWRRCGLMSVNGDEIGVRFLLENRKSGDRTVAV